MFGGKYLKDEADYYVGFAQEVWQGTDGAIEWLKEQTQKKS